METGRGTFDLNRGCTISTGTALWQGKTIDALGSLANTLVARS